MNCARAIVRLTLLEALRVRLPWVVGFSILIAVGLERFLDHVALIESRDIQAAVAAAAMRFTAAFIVITFVVTSMVRESTDKVTELLLSQPISRSSYYWSKLGAYCLLAALVGAALALPLLLATPGGAVLPWLAWLASLILELAIVAAASLFCVLSITQVAPAIAAAGAFYLLARSMGTLQLIAGAGHEPSLADRVINGVVKLIALLLPGLDGMTASAWLSQPPGAAQLGAVAMQAVAYVGLLAAASLFDLHRRNL